MKVAFYVGDHSNDNQLVRLGWQITRLVQKGPYSNVTHVEAIIEEHDDGSVTIASSSLRDGGVRSKQLYLDPTSWMIVDVLSWDVEITRSLLVTTRGMKYDLRGAIATALPGTHSKNRWFCNEWVATGHVKAPATFGPHQLAAIALSLNEDSTASFFENCKVKKELYAAKTS